MTAVMTVSVAVAVSVTVVVAVAVVSVVSVALAIAAAAALPAAPVPLVAITERAAVAVALATSAMPRVPVAHAALRTSTTAPVATVLLPVGAPYPVPCMPTVLIALGAFISLSSRVIAAVHGACVVSNTRTTQRWRCRQQRVLAFHPLAPLHEGYAPWLEFARKNGALLHGMTRSRLQGIKGRRAPRRHRPVAKSHLAPQHTITPPGDTVVVLPPPCSCRRPRSTAARAVVGCGVSSLNHGCFAVAALAVAALVDDAEDAQDRGKVHLVGSLHPFEKRPQLIAPHLRWQVHHSLRVAPREHDPLVSLAHEVLGQSLASLVPLAGLGIAIRRLEFNVEPAAGASPQRVGSGVQRHDGQAGFGDEAKASGRWRPVLPPGASHGSFQERNRSLR